MYIAQNLNHRAPAEQLGSEPSESLAQTESSSSVKVRDGCSPASNTASEPFCVAQDSPLPTLSLSDLERIAINEAIRQADGNIAAAAAILDISKATLYRKLKDS